MQLVENMPESRGTHHSSLPERAPPHLAFPPVSKDHILRCSYDFWFPKYVILHPKTSRFILSHRTWWAPGPDTGIRYKRHTFPTRILPIPQEVLDFLEETGIILADDSERGNASKDNDEWTVATRPLESQEDNAAESESDDEINTTPPNHRFPEFHDKVKHAIAELGGAVMPKLNWSAPKDAAFMTCENSLRCICPNDVYLLLKSSSFISRDLAHAFNGCSDGPLSASAQADIWRNNQTRMPYAPVLVLRSWMPVQPSLEFRCFVKGKVLIGISQRDRNHYEWLTELRGSIISKLGDFFEKVLRPTFPDHSYAFDVYIPEDNGSRDKLGPVELVDINPWAPRTDSLLFDWSELLTIQVPRMILGTAEGGASLSTEATSEEGSSSANEAEDEEFMPELRLVVDRHHASLMSTGYSAHKLPQEVVDAGRNGPSGMAEFMGMWQRMVDTRCRMED